MQVLGNETLVRGTGNEEKYQNRMGGR